MFIILSFSVQGIASIEHLHTQCPSELSDRCVRYFHKFAVLIFSSTLRAIEGAEQLTFADWVYSLFAYCKVHLGTAIVSRTRA